MRRWIPKSPVHLQTPPGISPFLTSNPSRLDSYIALREVSQGKSVGQTKLIVRRRRVCCAYFTSEEKISTYPTLPQSSASMSFSLSFSPGPRSSP
eukprot:479118-Amorphochlora_amoeboformis.AAC.1